MLIDMVHYNPGEAPFDTQFSSPDTLVRYGYDGQVIKDIHCATRLEALDPDIFPEGTPERVWVDAFAENFLRKLNDAKKTGLHTYSHIDLFVLPRRLLEKSRNRICDPATGRICLKQEYTRTILRAVFDEIFARFPLDGLIARTGETYLFDTPHHTGNGAVNYKGSRDQMQNEYIQLIRFLREEICVRHKKQLIFRTWDFCFLHTNQDMYEAVTNAVQTHENLLFSIKHVKGDFGRRLKFNPCLTRGNHPQIVEVQCQREDEGKGAFPNYIMDGVIDGFHEVPSDQGLRGIIHHPLIRGVYTWTRGGGWYGPYIANELYCNLHAGTLSRWLRNPELSEKQAFIEYATEVEGFTPEDAAKLRTLGQVSAEALLHGKYVEAYDAASGQEWAWEVIGWMRDDRMGPAEHLVPVFDYLTENGLLESALQEKKQALQIWDTVRTVFNEIQFPSDELRKFVDTSIEYGKRLFTITTEAWHIAALGYRIEKGQAELVQDLQAHIAAYDAAWKAYRQLPDQFECCSSLYHDTYLNLPGDPPEPGFGETVNRYRTMLSHPQH